MTLQIAAVHLPPLQAIFDTTALTSAQWALAAATALTVLIAEEVGKAVVRAMGGTERTLADTAGGSGPSQVLREAP